MNQQAPSFIPQRPTQGVVKKRNVRKIYILTYVSYVLFFGSALTAVGVFFYSTLLDSQLQAQKDALVTEKDKFNQSDIDSIRSLDVKIDTAKRRMDLHLSLLPVFEAFEKNISQTLELNSFNYTRENDENPVVSVAGKATILNNLMFQNKVFFTNPILSGSTFEEYALNTVPPDDTKVGNVDADDLETTIVFNVTHTIPSSLIPYTPQMQITSSTTENPIN